MAGEEAGCILEPSEAVWEDEWMDIGGEGVGRPVAETT